MQNDNHDSKQSSCGRAGAPAMNRREMLERCGLGFGMLGLAGLLADDRVLAAAGTGNPLAAKRPHFPARAKHVIHLFANGGPAHMDTFDPKPALARYAGQRLPRHLKTERPTGVALPSPFKFRRYGQSGLEVSEMFQQLASRHADDLCVIRSMVAEAPVHQTALMLMNTGDSRLPRPSVGSWINYGLGTENQNLPGFVALIPSGSPVEGPKNWRSAFLPGAYQGVNVHTHRKDGKYLEDLRNALDDLRNTRLDETAQRQQLDALQVLNRHHQQSRPGDPQLEARIQNYEIAYRMQTEATDAFDLKQEPEHILRLYGETPQARQMLMARRLVERGVRYVQLWHGNNQPWDSHENIEKEYRQLGVETDQGLAALLTDLKQRGLLEETLVIWGGEFGRTPTVELTQFGVPKATAGRDHNHHGFSVWLAGGGVKGGTVYGATDEFGFQAVENRTQVHDLHATLLYLLGLDHEKLTYRHAGRDFRLTDVHGHVIREILA